MDKIIDEFTKNHNLMLYITKGKSLRPKFSKDIPKLLVLDLIIKFYHFFNLIQLIKLNLPLL
jgi:hypothetical protein